MTFIGGLIGLMLGLALGMLFGRVALPRVLEQQRRRGGIRRPDLLEGPTRRVYAIVFPGLFAVGGAVGGAALGGYLGG